MKLTMTTQTGAFAAPARALDLVVGQRDRSAAAVGAGSVLGSALAAIAARTASARVIADVPTPVLVRQGAAHG